MDQLVTPLIQWSSEDPCWSLVCFFFLTYCRIANIALSATALQSLEIASDCILSGKAKVMIAGGFDDISEEGSYEFANMKATSNAETEFAMGREPTEMSRPATTSRAGFMESQVFRTSTSNKHVMLTVDEGYWCSYCDECEDCTGTWCSNSWYPCFHIYVHVRLPSFLISQSSLNNLLVTKQVALYLRLAAVLSLLRDKSLQNTPRLSWMLHTVLVNFRSVAHKSLNGYRTNTLSCRRKLDTARFKGILLKTTISQLALQISRRRPYVRRKTLSPCMVC